MSQGITIREVFDKSRDPLRQLNTIVKVYDDSSENIWIEFEEFILTEALLNYLYQFYEDFSASLHFDSPKMPFWLEGFYGSGKSHFSKVIGLLFQNSEIITPEKDKISAIEFFTNKILPNAKFKDARLNKARDELISSLELFPKKFNCRTIFINLAKYSKSESAGRSYLESFMMALLKEFNNFLNLSSLIETAELEKNLIKDGLYEKFKEEVLKEKGKTWEEIRKASPRARTTFLNLYPKLANCDKVEANAYLNGAIDDSRQKNIEDVLEEINQWAEINLSVPEKGLEGKILIILDEAGIFFSSAEARIGELISAAEWIHNPVKKSRINMILNAQQNLKKYIEMSNVKADFHKSEQRFKHWFLDKRNIKTVVVQRWLKKDENSQGKLLTEFIDKQYPNIIDGTVFNTINDPNLEYVKPNRSEIIETYPFLPFQFPMMIQITQKLITKKIVEEEYGGKTRSILTITREIIDSKSPYSDKQHFIEEELGAFVNLSQIYDSILYTLRRKEENQILLIDKTSNLVEDPLIFNKEEQDLPITFNDVAKAIYLLQFVDEIYSNDHNVTKSLFYSVDVKKSLFEEKISKLIEILKKKGYISYEKRSISDEKGKVQEIWEYKIATKEERKVIEESFAIHVTDDDLQKRLIDFFKQGKGKDLIDFRDTMNIPSLKKAGKEYKLKNAIRINLNWELDPDIDTILGKLDSDSNRISIFLFTPRFLNKNIADISKLQKNLTVKVRKAFEKRTNLILITPSLSQTTQEISEKSTSLDELLKDSIRYKKVISRPTTPPNVIQTFNQRLQNIDDDILELLKEELEEGFIFHGNGNITKIGKENINSKISSFVKESYSSTNKHAWLGQARITTNDISTILTWDPKKKNKISSFLKKTDKDDLEYIALFNKQGTDLQPNLSQQHGMINIEFKKLINQGGNVVSGEALLNIFMNPPYSWKDSTLFGVIAAMIRNNEWDVFKGTTVKNPSDKLIIDAFTDTSRNKDKFKALNFKIAEQLTTEQLTSASTLLRELFNEHITTPGPDTIDPAIVRSLETLLATITEIKSDVEKIQFHQAFSQQIKTIKGMIESVMKNKRRNERIKAFIDAFEIYGKKGAKNKEYENFNKHVYRLKEVITSGEVKRYYQIKEFLNKTISEWLKIETELKNAEQLNKDKEKIIEDLKNPDVLLEENWDLIWKKSETLWKSYWTSYKTLHKKIIQDIEDGVKQIEAHEKHDNVDPKALQGLKSLFTCTEKIIMPEKINSDVFTCSKCKDTYSILKHWESEVDKKVREIEAELGEEKGLDKPIRKPVEAWNAYQTEHKKIEDIFVKLRAQESIYARNPEKLDLIRDFKENFAKKYPRYSLEHSCGDTPLDWEIAKLICTTCKLNHDDLIDMNAHLSSKFDDLVSKLTEKDISLPYEIEIILDGQSEQSDSKKLQENSQLLNTFLTTCKKNKPKMKLKIKINIDKVD